MCRVVLPCLHQFKIKVSIKESSLFIPLGEVGGGGKVKSGGEQKRLKCFLGGRGLGG